MIGNAVLSAAATVPWDFGRCGFPAVPDRYKNYGSSRSTLIESEDAESFASAMINMAVVCSEMLAEL